MKLKAETDRRKLLADWRREVFIFDDPEAIISQNSEGNLEVSNDRIEVEVARLLGHPRGHIKAACEHIAKMVERGGHRPLEFLDPDTHDTVSKLDGYHVKGNVAYCHECDQTFLLLSELFEGSHCE